MKKTKVFKRLIVSVLALSMVLGSFCMTFAEEQSDKPADEPKAELVVSEIGYDEIAAMYEDTIVAQKDGKWGIAKFDGTVVVAFEYDSITSMDKDTFLAKKGDKWGMVKSDGTVLVPFEYDDCSSYDTNDGVVVLGKFIQSSYYGGLYDYYAFDKSGKELYYASHNGDEKEWSVNNLIYYNGLYKFSYGIPFTDNNKETYTDSKGNTILKVQWNLSPDANVKSNYKSTNLSPYGYAVAYPSDILFKDNENVPFIYLVSKDGCKELNVDINGVEPLLINGESIYCYDNEGIYFLNISTNKLVKIYEYIGDTQLKNASCGFRGDILCVEENGIYSLFDANGKAITDKKYSYVESSYEVKKYYLVCENDKYFYIDADGKEYGTEFKDVSNFVDGQAIVLNQDGQAYIIDENFNQISESISADVVTSFNKNAYSIKKADGKYYPVYMKSSADTYTKELTDNSEIISSTDFSFILAENAAKNVVIKNADGVTFTFDKGTMTAVEGKTEYDFGTTIIRDYDKATGLSTEFTRDNFALQIIYNYSGKLPAKADITINVGSEFAGKTLYYYLCNGDKTYTLIQNVVVDTDGFVTVEQDHCSTYVLTSSELLSKPDTDTGKDTNTDKNNGDKPANEAPATGDTTNYILYIILLVASLGAMLLAGSKIADRA